MLFLFICVLECRFLNWLAAVNQISKDMKRYTITSADQAVPKINAAELYLNKTLNVLQLL